MELAECFGPAAGTDVEIKQEKKRIRVLTLVEGVQDGCDSGIESIFQFESQRVEFVNRPESINEHFDALVIPEASRDHLVPQFLGRIPLIAVVEKPEINKVLALLKAGVNEVLTLDDCRVGRLAYAVMAAMTRFQRERREGSATPRYEEKALQTLDRLPFGVVFISPDAQMLFMNSAARQVCGSGRGLYLSDGNRCCAVDRDENALLHRTVKRIGESSDSQDEGPYTLKISGDNGEEGLSLLAVPVGSDQSSRGVALFLNGSGGAFDLSVGTIKSIYSFTDSEALLVIGLVHGSTLAEIAQERDVTLHTVRAQLKSVFAKTGAKRQAELIKQILTGPAVLVQR